MRLIRLAWSIELLARVETDDFLCAEKSALDRPEAGVAGDIQDPLAFELPARRLQQPRHEMPESLQGPFGAVRERVLENVANREVQAALETVGVVPEWILREVSADLLVGRTARLAGQRPDGSGGRPRAPAVPGDHAQVLLRPPHPPQPFDGVRRHRQELSRLRVTCRSWGCKLLCSLRPVKRAGAARDRERPILSALSRRPARCGWPGRSGLQGSLALGACVRAGSGVASPSARREAHGSSARLTPR